MPMTLGPVTDPVSSSSLRVFQPRTRPATHQQITKAPESFGEFDTAFQNATGWEVAWNPPRDRRNRHGRGSDPANRHHDWIRIADMSHRLPPGVPAVSRLYCENMILKLNRVLSDFSNSEEKRSNKSKTRHSTITPANGLGSPEPCFLDSVSVVPIVSTPLGHKSSTGFQWIVRSDGSFMVGAFEISGSAELNHPGLVAAQASFLAASRFGGDCNEVVNQIRSGIEQVFCGDVEIRMVVWALDPLLGFATICGDDCFAIRLDRQDISIAQKAMTGFLWLRGQNLVLNSKSITQGDDETETWINLAERAVNRSLPVDWKAAIAEQTQRAVPRIRNIPNLALAMARH